MKTRVKIIGLREARTNFARIVEEAQTGPVVLMKFGKPAGVLLGAEHATPAELDATIAGLVALRAKRRKAS